MLQAWTNFWWQINANDLKFIEECVMCTEKHRLVKKVYKFIYIIGHNSCKKLKIEFNMKTG